MVVNSWLSPKKLLPWPYPPRKLKTSKILVFFYTSMAQEMKGRCGA